TLQRLYQHRGGDIRAEKDVNVGQRVQVRLFPVTCRNARHEPSSIRRCSREELQCSGFRLVSGRRVVSDKRLSAAPVLLNDAISCAIVSGKQASLSRRQKTE